MARAKANPDPAIEEYATRSGRTVRIEAFRHGGYNVWFGEKLVAVRAAQLGAFFGAPKYPSNRLQDEAMRDAKLNADRLRDDLF
jgi:hypothetical protein